MCCNKIGVVSVGIPTAVAAVVLVFVHDNRGLVVRLLELLVPIVVKSERVRVIVMNDNDDRSRCSVVRRTVVMGRCDGMVFL